MSARIAALVATLTTLVLAGPAAAQVVDNPPGREEIGEVDNWTFPAMKALFLVSLLVVAAVAVGYVVKSREFKANQRRGGSK